MDSDRQSFVVQAPQAGRTVLSALRDWLPGQSWSALRKLLAARRVLVNHALCLDEARRLKEGEVVELSGRAHRPPPSVADVAVVYLDADVIVVDKPSGMITLRHAAERDWSIQKKALQPALDEVLPVLISRREPRQKSSDRGIYSVHRIDRETSGLLVFARHVSAQQMLIAQFKAHSVERTYLAVARGDLAAQTFESQLVDDRGDGRRGSTSLPGVGKRAVTHVQPIERLGEWTFLKCRLETGRTHQIRIHLSEAGHPVYGDTKYGMPRSPNDPPQINRLALHAATLGFDHPTDGRRLQFESPLPRDLQELVASLREG